MLKLFFNLLFVMVLISFLANPAPKSVGIGDVMMMILPSFIALICLITTNGKVYPTNIPLMIALVLYLFYLLLSTIIGLVHGVPLLYVLRSIGPYLNFFPLLIIGVTQNKYINPRMIATIFILVGLLQISYLIYLYFTHNIESTKYVLINRITLEDPRTTLPLLLAVPILPIIFSLYPHSATKHHLKHLVVALFIFLGFIASIVTLTRAIFLSVLFSWIIFLALYFYRQLRLGLFSPSLFLRKSCFYLPIFVILLLTISCIPRIHLLELALLSRFIGHGYHPDYSNGRLFDEWLPALTTWVQAGFPAWFFGIGAGNTFTVPTGETRTYIHNLCIYTLVYGGLYGFFASLFLYFIAFKTLVTRTLQSEDLSYLAFAALLASMFFYGQLFAVHKVLSFNAMLFLILALALNHSDKKINFSH